MKAILGPAGFLRYQQNKDWSFREVRNELRNQDFTDEQINAAYAARRAASERQVELQKQQRDGTLNPEESQQQSQAAQAALQQDLKQALGDEAYLAYLKADDDNYRQLRKDAPAWQLTQADIDLVWETLHDYKTQAETASEARQKLLARLGQERFDRLKRAGIIQLPEE